MVAINPIITLICMSHCLYPNNKINNLSTFFTFLLFFVWFFFNVAVRSHTWFWPHQTPVDNNEWYHHRCCCCCYWLKTFRVVDIMSITWWGFIYIYFFFLLSNILSLYSTRLQNSFRFYSLWLFCTSLYLLLPLLLFLLNYYYHRSTIIVICTVFVVIFFFILVLILSIIYLDLYHWMHFFTLIQKKEKKMKKIE